MDSLRSHEPLALPANKELGQIEDHDVVVIGSGPGASLAACVLAEAGREVLVLEEGNYWPLEAIEPFSVDELKLKYRNGGITFALGRPLIQYVEGRCLGGGSEINSGLHHRLPDGVIWDWSSRFGLVSFNPVDLNVHSEAVEKDLKVSLAPEGTIPKVSLLLKAGAEALGWNCPEVPRYRSFSSASPEGERQTMVRTYLPRARKAGARIIEGARVESIRPKKDKWLVKVSYINSDGQKKRGFFIAKTIFLGAGTIGSSVILKSSGLSAKSGQFFHLHPTVKWIAQFDQEINYPGLGVSVHQVKEFGTSMSFGCSISSPHYMLVSMSTKSRGQEVVREKWPFLAVYYAAIVPEGHGAITVLPGFDEPIVRFSLTKRDLASLSLAFKRLGQALFAAGAKRLYPSIRGLESIESPADLDKIPTIPSPGSLEAMSIHLTSSNRMAGSPKLGVVDQWGALWGHHDFYVTDASILCSAPGVNPQGPLLTVVRRNLTHYLGG
ncbi:MAG: GMC family oxidoreductase N-terminal domain-containing protein [Deltaproteobacteria bacterium]|nr:GMC family oxidoreductase N-terminal domain-containing protein [Deltaproteobacteria bacterium]